MNKKVDYNSKITMHYSISNDKGLVFESTFDKQPITFVVGDGTIPQKLEVTLYGLEVNKTQSLLIEPKDAFGIKDENKTKTIEKSSFPNAEMIKMNNVIEIDTKDHENKKTTSLAIIKEINKETVVLDLNHPLAGIPIEFKVKIVNIYE